MDAFFSKQQICILIWQERGKFSDSEMIWKRRLLQWLDIFSHWGNIIIDRVATKRKFEFFFNLNSFFRKTNSFYEAHLCFGLFDILFCWTLTIFWSWKFLKLQLNWKEWWKVSLYCYVNHLISSSFSWEFVIWNLINSIMILIAVHIRMSASFVALSISSPLCWWIFGHICLCFSLQNCQ